MELVIGIACVCAITNYAYQMARYFDARDEK
jgi:hypothetical protein